MQRLVIAAAMLILSIGQARADVIYNFDLASVTGTAISSVATNFMSLEITDAAYQSGDIPYSRKNAYGPGGSLTIGGSGVVAFDFQGRGLNITSAVFNSHFSIDANGMIQDGGLGFGTDELTVNASNFSLGTPAAIWSGSFTSDEIVCFNDNGVSCKFSGSWSAPIYTDTLAEVPEPSSLSLMLGMLIALGIMLVKARHPPAGKNRSRERSFAH